MMDSCEWKLTDGELAEIKEKRIAELTTEVENLKGWLRDSNRGLDRCVRQRDTFLQKNQRLRDAAKAFIKELEDNGEHRLTGSIDGVWEDLEQALEGEEKSDGS